MLRRGMADVMALQACLQQLKGATSFEEAKAVAVRAMELRKTASNQSEEFRALVEDLATQAINRAEELKVAVLEPEPEPELQPEPEPEEQLGLPPTMDAPTPYAFAEAALQTGISYERAGDGARAKELYTDTAQKLLALRNSVSGAVEQQSIAQLMAQCIHRLEQQSQQPAPTTTAERQAPPRPQSVSDNSDAELRARLDALKRSMPAAPTDQDLHARFAKLAGRPAVGAGGTEPEPGPAPRPRMSAEEADRYEREKLLELGLPASGGFTEVERLLAEAVASNKLAHRYGERIEGLDDDDGPSGEHSDVSLLMQQAHDAARLEQKYGASSTSASSVAGDEAGQPASKAQAGGEHAHSSDDEDDDVDASVKRWLRSLGLGQHIDAIAAFANDMEEVAWITKEQAMLLPMTASERERLLVAIARLPTPD